MKQVRIGIVGVGEAAQNFHLPIYSKLANVELYGVYDRNSSKAKAIAEKYEITKHFKSLDDLLKCDEIDAIDICTPTDSHIDIAIKSIETGKHVLLEKPIARNLDEALLIDQAAQKSKSIIMVATNQRFRYDAMVLKSFVQNGEIGDIYYVKGKWHQQKSGKEWRHQIDRAGGGVLIDLGVSLLDSLLWICNFPKVQSVNCSTFNHQSKNIEDVSVASIKFENNMMATLETSWSLHTEKSNFSFDIIGSKGQANINPLRLFKKENEPIAPQFNTGNISNIAIHRKSYENEIKHFINSIIGHTPLISSTSEAVEVMRIIKMLYDSAKQNKPILVN